MPLDLRAIKERLAKATPGPWERDRTEVQGPKELHLCDLRRWEDAALIANAPADLSALVSEVESLRALLVEAVTDIDEEYGHTRLAWLEAAVKALGPDTPEWIIRHVAEYRASAIREEP